MFAILYIITWINAQCLESPLRLTVALRVWAGEFNDFYSAEDTNICHVVGRGTRSEWVVV